MAIRTTLLMTAVLLALTPAAIAQKNASRDGKTAAKKLFCWDQNGTRVCSDALPPEAVNAARDEISASSGLRTGGVDRALNEQERALAAIEAQQRMADAAAAETRRRTDEAMLLSYRSEEDLRRVFNERTAIVDNNVRTARYNTISLREGLVTLLQTAGDRELAGRPVTDEMTATIRQRHADLVRTRRLQQSFEAQRAELDVEIAGIMERYRAAMGLTPAAPNAGAQPASTDTPPAAGSAPTR